ncbi:50S ribosomal protein L25/general stress protein Ctc [Pararhizobium sp.]|uniref:50S ribosomal protein L25/general stress protein Ctc n=1 Tax=Pararhizobium sp. TaxID=1977563 RepID=UPI002723ACD3|nr:50S ribosomal protein L25/general stress protein Ctc [Pararhizobium sp.]MDO9414795.1 50S ribosomal protein L25/general stress protein Ctc [Pararhizobium sp.]
MSHASYELKAETRERVGKGSSRELRRNGLIPAVIYGDKQAPLAISLTSKDVTLKIHAGGFMTTIAVIDVKGEKIRVLPKDYQLDPVRDFTLHVDFLRVSKDSVVTVEVPVHFVNEEKSPGLKVGGVLNIVRHEVELVVPVDEIPEFLTADLTGLKLGEGIHISHIKLPKNAHPVISDRDFTIATIATPAAGVDESAEETE